MNCESCRQQMLPYLYDLLEPPERQELAAHIESCVGCQDALKAAQDQIGLLAEAIKQDTTDIVFRAPTKATPASTAPTLLLPPMPRRSFLFNRWAMAASLLLFLFVIGAGLGFASWREHARTLDEAQTRLAKAQFDLSKSKDELNQKKQQTQTEILAIQKELDQIFNQWKKEENTQKAALEKDSVQLNIDGPKSPVAGAPNTYNFEMRPDQNFLNNLNQSTQPKGMQQNLPGIMPPVQARVIDQNKKVLYQQDVAVQGNNYRGQVVLPPNMAIKPGEQLAMEFQTKNADGKMVNLTNDPFTLGLPEYVTHLTTDRPLYRPGETVRFRSLTLERFSLKPAEQDFHLRFRIVGPREVIFNQEFVSQVIAGKDQTPIKGPDGKPVRGLGVGEFALPTDLPEGPYTLFVSEVNERFNEEKRTFQVRRSQTPRFNKEVQFDRDSYGPGDQVSFQVKAVPVMGMGGRGTLQVTAAVDVDGHNPPVEMRDKIADDGAHFEFTCTLPPQLDRGVGKVTITCNDGTGPETTIRALPIALRDLQVEFYPEGGDLIAGIPNRVYFQARTPANKPADFEGVILDGKQEIARIKTFTDEREPGINQGLGSFTFTPQRNRRYQLRIDAPIGIERVIPLPAIKNTGVVLSAPQGVVENEIRVKLTSAPTARELFVGAYCRGRMLDGQVVKVPANQTTPVTLKPQAGVGGVFRITVFEKTPGADGVFYRPLAERLIFRKSQERVAVKIDSDRKAYQPGEPVELSFRALDEKKALVPAIALVCVADNSVNRLIDDKTMRSLPTHFLLTTEVRNPEDLENADVLLGDHPKAAVALDLLLGCQGWRRFAEQDPQRFAQRQQPGQQPIFLANAASIPQRQQAEQKEIDKLDQTFVAKAIDVNKKLAEKEQDETGAPQIAKEVGQMEQQVQASQNEINAVQQRLRQTRGFFWRFGLGVALLTLLFIGFFSISVGLRRLAEGGTARPWLFTGLSLLILLFFASIIGTFTLMGEPLLDDWRADNPNAFQPWGVKPVAPPMPANNGNVPPPWFEIDIAESERNEIPPAPAPKPRGVMPAPLTRQVPLAQDQRELADNVRAAQGGPLAEVQDERTLRKQGNYQALLEKRLHRRVQLPPVNDACVVREYAHQHKPRNDDAPRDFAETLYWHPVLVMPDGKAQVTFDLADSITRYEVLVLCHTFDGRLGASRAEITAKLPFSFDPKLPIEVTQSDQLVIPVAVSNEKSNDIAATLSARVKGLQIEGNAQHEMVLKANETRRELFRVKPSIAEGDATFRIVGKTQGNSAAIERKLKVVPDGFPVAHSIGGVLENGPVEHVIDLPDQWIPGSLRVQAHFYPSPLAELQCGLEAMQREPAECFEQCASNNYANVLILNYLKQPFVQQDPFGPFVGNAQPNLGLENRARQLLQSGCLKLADFECREPGKENAKRGYEWFGGANPPNEALTAYGLLQYRDLAKLYPVDDSMLRRTEQYLLDQRDEKGGFQRNAGAIDPFGRAAEQITNAYVVWALTESGVQENLDGELAALSEQCKTTKDPYFLALVGMSQLNRKKTPQGMEILRTLERYQGNDGQIAGAKTSITGSQGRDLAVETTSLAILAWLKADRPAEFHGKIQAAVKWLGQQRQGQGGYGGTQATVLALKAMLAHAQKNPRNLQGGEAQISTREPVGVRPFGPDRFAFSARTQDSFTLTLDNRIALQPGKNVIHLKITGADTLPYTLTWSYRTLNSPSDPKAPVKLTAKLGAEQAVEGETVKLRATIENVSAQRQGMAVAIFGLPSGLSLPDGALQLKALAQWQKDKPGKIAAWELRGRELVLYWRELAPDAKIDIDLDLVCRLPGLYRGPASRVYLYYEGERKFWAEPLNIRIEETK